MCVVCIECVSVCVCVLRVRFPFCSGGLVMYLYDTHEAETQLIRFLDCGPQLIRPLLSFPFESLRLVDYFESSGIINMLWSAKFGSQPWV